MNEKTVEIKDIFDILYLAERHLTTAQVNLITSMKRQFKQDRQLSEKQLAVLRNIKRYLPAETEARMSNKIMR